MTRYLIIGAGAAGISAAEAIRSVDANGEVTVISEEADGYYSRPGLAYYLTSEIPEKHLYPFQESDFKRLQVRRLGAQVRRILPQEHQVELNDARRLSYDRLLIATGASAVQSKVPGSDLLGVVKLDTLDEARRILKLTHKTRRAVVVGGGITALELVEGLRARRIQTHYFLRGERYWSNVLDETESRIIEHRLKEEGVHIHYNTDLAEIIGKRVGKLDQVAGVRTVDGRQLACEMVAVAIGVQPRKALAEAAGLKVDRGVWVDEFLRTRTVEGDLFLDIYAAGDVAQVYDPLVGKAVVDSLWGPARQQGYTAGLNMAGQSVAYSKGVPFNVTRLAGLTTTIIGAVGGREVDEDLVGIARGDSETWRQLPDAIAAQSGFDVNHLRVLVGERTLMGAIVMGDQKLSQAIHHLVAEQADITPIREQLLNPSRPLGDILADFWITWRQHGAKQP